MPLLSFFTGIYLLGAQLMNPFIPGITVNDYGRMAVDVNQMRAAVSAVIPPDTVQGRTRNKEVLNEMETIIRAIEDYDEAYRRDGKELIYLYMTHGSKQEDFQRVLAHMDEQKAAGQKKIIEARFRMKQIMTPKEWKALFGRQG